MNRDHKYQTLPRVSSSFTKMSDDKQCQLKRSASESAEDLEAAAKKQRLAAAEEAECEEEAEDSRCLGREFPEWLFISRCTVYGDGEDANSEAPQLVRLYRSVLKRDFAGFKPGQRFHRVVWDAGHFRLELYETSEEECIPVVVELVCAAGDIWKPCAPLRDRTAEDLERDQRCVEQYPSLSDCLDIDFPK
jgi:hypothetical protein